ncbi:MAG: hypothetical protein AAFR34_10225 [Pseudomonadota bacterium]
MSALRGTPGYWALVAATLALYAVIAFWSLPYIASEAGGMPAFDARPAGYGFEDAQAFLAALSPAGRAHYLGTQAILDSMYPPLLFACVGVALWHLSQDMQKVTRGMVVAVAAVGMVADGFENVVVREMLAAGPNALTPGLVTEASRVTVVKSAAVTASFIALALIAVRRVARDRRGAA